MSMYAPSGANASAIREWELLTTQIMAQAEQLLDALNRPLRLWERNDLAGQVAAAAPDAHIGDSTLTAAQIAARARVFSSLMLWISTPITVGQDPVSGEPVHVTPMDLLSRR